MKHITPIFIAILFVFVACAGEDIIATPTPEIAEAFEVTATPTTTPTLTPTATLIPTITPTIIPTATLIPTITPTIIPTATSTPEAIPGADPTPIVVRVIPGNILLQIATPTPTPTSTPTPTATATATPEPTSTAVPTQIPTPTETATPVPTFTPVATPTPTQTPTPTPVSAIDTVSLQLIMPLLPNGFAGFSFEIFVPAGVRIIDASMPFALTSFKPNNENTGMLLTAVDLNNFAGVGSEDVLLATVVVQAVSPVVGDIAFNIIRFDDADGNPIIAIIDSVHIEVFE